jgi:hypothetical protein
VQHLSDQQGLELLGGVVRAVRIAGIRGRTGGCAGIQE